MGETGYDVGRLSNPLVIYGCGYSLNELTKEQWDELRGYDSIGFNWFILQDWIAPTHMLVGDIRPDKKVKRLGKTQDEAEERYWEEAKRPCYENTDFWQLDMLDMPHKDWNKSTTIAALYLAKKLGYTRVIYAGVDLYDYRFFFLDRDELRIMVSRKPNKGKFVVRKLKKPHPIYKKILAFFDEHADWLKDMEIYSYNHKSKLIESKVIKPW